MSKNVNLAISILTVFLTIGFLVYANPPPQPIVVYDSFEYSIGNPTVLAGITVEAKINGISYETIITTQANKYYLQIPSDIPETSGIKEGGSSLDIIEFYFDGVLANDTLTWPGAGATINKKLYIHHVPVLGTIGDKFVDENSGLTFTVGANDIDTDTITYSATVLPTGASINSTTGVFSWTPTYTQSGTYDVTFSASDGDSETTDPTETITITVGNVNRVPVLNTTLLDINFDEDGTKVMDMNTYFSDPDGTILSYTISGNTNVLFNSGTMTFSATADWFGAETITVNAFDGEDTVADTMVVTVNAVNDVPYISPVVNDIVTAEDTEITVDLTANENDVDNTGAELTWSVSGVDTSLFSALIDANDVLTITPV